MAVASSTSLGRSSPGKPSARRDRLIAQGVLAGPQPSDSELLATLGIDLDAVSSRVNETFSDDAYWRVAQRVAATMRRWPP